ncbi:hypothetical protein [cf. Phormidesmis sp. LEGE 11477]|uniref:hypothetical protein n=1 Tax=cf. Phormidesmis sp. LEGE 11477 TaxID=1828680 RepID=UPI0018827E45|nr:hypothetical protein [cf. Phormidesmis sp. LEGE 11477]
MDEVDSGGTEDEAKRTEVDVADKATSEKTEANRSDRPPALPAPPTDWAAW